jgi:hypothetical protein
MSVDIGKFWGTDYDHNPPLTNEMLEQAEQFLGVKIPKELTALWRVQNGGYTQGFVFPCPRPTSWAEDHVPVMELFGIGSPVGPKGIHNVLNSKYMIDEWGLPANQVLLTGDGHWWITLDYRKSAEPRVTWLDIDSGQDFELAPSFKEFFSNLVPDSAVDNEACRLCQ